MCRLPLLIITALFLLPLTVEGQQKKPSPSPSPTQPETEDVVHISTELVQTDVMVFDKDGRFVTGLKPDQFELLVDGKPQPITLFESIVTGGRSESSVLRSAGGKKPSPAPVTEDGNESVVGRTILFFVNDLHLEPGSIARVNKMITKYIDTMLGPHDQVAITSSSGQIGFLQQLTNNQIVLRAALDRLRIVAGAAPDMQRPYMSPYAAYLMVERNDRTLYDHFVQETMKANSLRPGDEPIAAAMVDQRSKTIVRQSDAATKNALSSLVNLMRATAKLPGRKLVFFISDGFLPNFTGSDFTIMMGRVTGAANNSNVII